MIQIVMTSQLMFLNFSFYKKFIDTSDSFIDCEDFYEKMKKNSFFSDEITDTVYKSVSSWFMDWLEHEPQLTKMILS